MTKEKRKDIIQQLSATSKDCPICDRPLKLTTPSRYFRIELDHIIPRSDPASTDEVSNLRMVHAVCNRIRGDKPAMWRLEDLWKPK